MKHKTKQRKGALAPRQPQVDTCRYCGRPVEILPASKIYKRAREGEKLCVCTGYPQCDAYVRCHPGTEKPMGTLAKPELRMLRQQAHSAFNKLYQYGYMKKDDAYSWLAGLLGVSRAQAHIGYQDDFYCKLIIVESRKKLTWLESAGTRTGGISA